MGRQALTLLWSHAHRTSNEGTAGSWGGVFPYSRVAHVVQDVHINFAAQGGDREWGTNGGPSGWHPLMVFKLGVL